MENEKFDLESIDQEKIDRFIECISRIPLWNTLMNSKEVKYLFEHFPAKCSCGGEMREITRKRLGNGLYKVFTERIRHENINSNKG